MVEKIISGGQTGADRAALDVAIRLGLDHGGWIAKGRLAEDGPLPETYGLSETGSADSRVRTEKNVISADGTLIVSHGELTGGSAYTREVALAHDRIHLHVDLNELAAFEAAGRINAWLKANGISVLNVAGPRASEDPEIYRAVCSVLDTVLHLNLMEGSGPDRFRRGGSQPGFPVLVDLPKTVEQAAKHLERLLSFKEKAELARRPTAEGLAGRPELAVHIRNTFRLPVGNPGLMESCRAHAGNPDLPPEAAEEVLLDFFLKRLRKSHGLRRIK